MFTGIVTDLGTVREVQPIGGGHDLRLVIGTSPGAAATAMAQQHLRNILVFLDMPVMAQPEGFIRWSDGLIDAQGEIGEASRKFLQGYMSQFLAWVQGHRKA